MGYLADITKQIKNGQDIIFVGTGIILINKYKKILMACRVDNNKWSLPGGSLEVGESLEDCIIRETFEETGIVVNKESIKLSSAVSLTEPIEKNGVSIYIVSIVYKTDKYNDNNMRLDSREFSKYGWLTLEEIKKLSQVTSYSYEALSIYEQSIVE